MSTLHHLGRDVRGLVGLGSVHDPLPHWLWEAGCVVGFVVGMYVGFYR